MNQEMTLLHKYLYPVIVVLVQPRSLNFSKSSDSRRSNDFISFCIIFPPYHVQLYDKDNGYIVIREDNLEILYLSMFWKIFSDNNTSRIIGIAAGDIDFVSSGKIIQHDCRICSSMAVVSASAPE